MYNKINLNSKNYNMKNNSIFKQVDTNIISDYQRNMYLNDLIQNHNNSGFYNDNIYHIDYNKSYLNGTLDHDEKVNIIQTQKTIRNINKSNYNTNTNKNIKKKPTLNRYNSYGRMNTNINNNTINTHKNKKISNSKKALNNNHKQNKIQNNNNNGYGNIQLPNKKAPLSNKKKKNIIPLGSNKYKTIGDNNNYSKYGNIMHNENNINKTFVYNQGHNTIDFNNYYSNKGNNITRKYNIKMPTNNINYNFNYNYNTNNKQFFQKNNIYNCKDIEISNKKRNNSKSRPKTPDFNKRGKSSSRFNSNNQKAKTPDRNRKKMKLNLNRDYLYTADNKSNKKNNHNNYFNRDYNYTIDNSSNNGKYQYKNQFKRLNTNDYFKLHKKTINNYEYNDTIDTNNNTITSNYSNSRKYSYGKINCKNQENKKAKKLSKNASQGSILGYNNNYNINLNSNGINHVHKVVNDKFSHYHSNTNLVTPIKYTSQKSNFKEEPVQMTQIRPPNNYNIYEETFQSFGRKLPTSINNEYNYSIYNQNKNISERNNINNYYTNLKKNIQKETIQDLKKKNSGYHYNYDEKKRLSIQNNNNSTINNNERQKLNYELEREKNGNYNNNTYVPATINNIGNKTCSYFNKKKDIIINQKENINYNNEEINPINDIDFNDLDQFSPPYSKEEVDLTKNIDNKKNKYNNLYMNIGSMEEYNDNYKKNNDFNYNYNQKYNYGQNFNINENNDNNNRRVIDDFINQLKTKF